MNNQYSALEIARYIINKCTVENSPISNLQLQKILYFLQKEYLVNRNSVLFSDEIQAWQFGPVVPEVYYQYCGFGSMAITMNYEVEIGADDISIIDRIVNEKRCKNPWDLVSETHVDGKAWAIVYRDGIGNHSIIPTELIRTRG
ncbi:Panacea domain-containing protein [Dethiothermospora halolimnae]|uniref:Panacea domain-containing protein n=1 Tax=Dethiothermospora halolimnae TaxID=3114390 RepID=UPI003CCC2498